MIDAERALGLHRRIVQAVAGEFRFRLIDMAGSELGIIQASAESVTEGDAELVVACTLDNAGLETQSRRWRELHARAEVRQIKTPQGKRVYFRADEGVLRELTELAAVENDCCSWAQWKVESLNGEVVLHVTSSPHGVDAIHRMFRHRQRKRSEKSRHGR